MNTDEFNQFCGSLKATLHVVQWGNADVWKVGGKVFAIGGWGDKVDRNKADSQQRKPAFTFKVSEMNFELLKEQAGYRPAPYLASRGFTWIQQTDTSKVLDDDLKYYIESSYRLVVSGLSKKKQRELGISS